MRDIIRVRIEHFAGGLARGPADSHCFPRGNVSPEIKESADFAITQERGIGGPDQKEELGAYLRGGWPRA